MKFPFGSHEKEEQKELQGVIRDNAEILQEHLKNINWKYLIKVYFSFLLILLITFFSIVFVIRLALTI